MNIRDLDLNSIVGIPLGGTMYSLSLTGDIESFGYTEFIAFLDTLSEQDVVKLNINTYGGCAATTSVLYDAIQQCPAYFIAQLSGVCQSCGTVIALACDEWVGGAAVDFMIHGLQVSSKGDGFTSISDTKKHLDQDLKYNSIWLKAYYQDFLTDDEFKRIEAGEDIHYYADTLPERLEQYRENRAKRLTEKAEKSI